MRSSIVFLRPWDALQAAAQVRGVVRVWNVVLEEEKLGGDVVNRRVSPPDRAAIAEPVVKERATAVWRASEFQA